MVGRKGTNVEAAAKRRIQIFSASRTCPETQPELQNVNSLDSSKVSLPTESKYH
jgi:hypothetical protein